MPPRPDAPASIFLDMIGGIAGDMFIAALTDLDPRLETVCRDAFEAIRDRPNDLRAVFFDHSDIGRFGKRFHVETKTPGNPGSAHHGHLAFPEAIRIVRDSGLSEGVKARSESLFESLAKTEGDVHGVDYREVEFHEIGGWDSVVDILLSAAIIEELGSVRWQCGPVPMGRGSIQTAHGCLPVPAPATLKLLQGFDAYQDEFPGERVTPTGAAILRHLEPEQSNGMPLAALLGDGSGYGSRQVRGLANVLRAYSLAPAPVYSRDAVGVLGVADQNENFAADVRRQCEGLRFVRIRITVKGQHGFVCLPAVRRITQLEHFVDGIGMSFNDDPRRFGRRNIEGPYLVQLGDAVALLKHLIDIITARRMSTIAVAPISCAFGDWQIIHPATWCA